ncbi:MAG: SCP2 sterol-binding domain-containing protein [bacterium]|nr:SCP2 sterol-binding domain-containing protein [bacterium]
MSEAELTIRELFEKVARGIERDPQKVAQINAVFLFKVSGPQGGFFHLDLKDQPGVSFEEKPADCILEVRDRDLLKMFKGILPGYKAVLSGKLKVRGELALATRLSDVFFAAKADA